MRWLVLVLLVGCGDNHLPSQCADVEPATFTAGPYADPYAIELTGCVEGGLGDIAGRWFLRDPDELFELSYPRYESTCDGGARFFGNDNVVVTTEEGDLYSYQQWWDGTRAVMRSYTRYQTELDFEYTTVYAVCARADGTLVGRWVHYDDDFGERTGPLLGTRFDRKDELAAGLELVGEINASTTSTPLVGYNVVVEAGIAYVAGPGGLDLIDVSVPDAPRAISHLEDSWNDVRVVRGETEVVAYGANNFETVVVDVTNPTRPTAVGTLGRPGFSYAHSLQVAKGRLYVADYTDAVPVYDVTNPLVPTPLSSVVSDSDGGIHDLTVAGDRLFINQTEAGFVVLDVSAGLDKPTVLGRAPGTYSHASAVGSVGARTLALHGDEGLTGPEGGAFLRVFDGDPASATFMTELGRYQSRPEVGIHNIELVGERAYIAYYQDGVRVVDLSDPTAPREVAHYNTWDPETAGGGAFEGALGIRVVDGLIYVADSERGLLIFRETR